LSSLATIGFQLDLRGNLSLGMHLRFCHSRRNHVSPGKAYLTRSMRPMAVNFNALVRQLWIGLLFSCGKPKSKSKSERSGSLNCEHESTVHTYHRC